MKWLKKNFFSTWYYTLLTILTVLFVYYLLYTFFNWAFFIAQWRVIQANIRLFLIGIYPEEAIWRIWCGIIILFILLGVTWKKLFNQAIITPLFIFLFPLLLAWIPISWSSRIFLLAACVSFVAGAYVFSYLLRKRNTVFFCWLVYLPLFILLVRGLNIFENFTYVSSTYWSGLLLTFLIAILGILFSFPLGVLLALGRRCSLPVIRYFCVLYIEIIRGMPLITVLFMMQVMLPLFLPEGINIDRVLRAILAFICFSSAYLAENVRGGLQSVPKGQEEAAWALGMSRIKTMVFVILPQALRNIIPILVGQFISLFKDTSLVAVVGLLDFLGIAQSILANPNFLGRQKEVYVFIAIIYWFFSWSLSVASQRLEKRLKVKA